jgi:hypothetical protein
MNLKFEHFLFLYKEEEKFEFQLLINLGTLLCLFV